MRIRYCKPYLIMNCEVDTYPVDVQPLGARVQILSFTWIRIQCASRLRYCNFSLGGSLHPTMPTSLYLAVGGVGQHPVCHDTHRGILLQDALCLLEQTYFPRQHKCPSSTLGATFAYLATQIELLHAPLVEIVRLSL